MTPFHLVRLGEHQANIASHTLTDSAVLQLQHPKNCLKNKYLNARQIPRSHNSPFLKSSNLTDQKLCFNSMQNKIYTASCFHLEKHS